MTMLTLNGTIMNIYKTPEGKNKEGEVYGGQDKIQIMCENTLRNGQKRNELIDLTVENAANFGQGESVSIPVGIFVSKGEPKFYALKGQ